MMRLTRRSFVTKGLLGMAGLWAILKGKSLGEWHKEGDQYVGERIDTDCSDIYYTDSGRFTWGYEEADQYVDEDGSMPLWEIIV